MKLFGMLLAALVGVTAATCPADDMVTEMTKENLEAEDGYSPVNDTPAATGNVPATTPATAIDLVSLDVFVQPVCYAYEWGVAEQQQQQQQLNMGLCGVGNTEYDDGVVSATFDEEKNDDGEVSATSSATSEEENIDDGEVSATSSSATSDEDGSTADLINDDNASGHDDNADGDKEENFTGHYDAPTDAEEDADVPNTESSGELDVDTSSTGLESILRVRKKLRKDPSFRVVLSPGRDAFNPPSLRMFALTKDLATGTTPTKESWTFTARDREERDMWTDGLAHAIREAATFGEEEDIRDLATPPSDVMELKTKLRGMQPRKVTLTGNTLTMCKIAKGGKGTKGCQEMTLFEFSDAVRVKDDKKDSKGTTTRSLFMVTDYPWQPATKSWTFDAGSPEEQARWIKLLKDAIHGTKTVVQDTEVDAPSSSGSMYPYSRGRALGPKDEPLVLGQYMSNLCPENPTTMEVNGIGDVLLSPGLYPDHKQDPLWAHRVTAAFMGRANGGLVCALENWWQQHTNGEEIPAKLSVKNGRWRVGRGLMCTLGRSPAPEGSLRRFLPWDERGKAVREGSLYLLDDGSAVIASGQHLLWDSKT